MQKRFVFGTAGLLVFILCAITGAQAQDKPYTEGTVWEVSFIKLKPNMGDIYLKTIANSWIKVHDEAQAQGLIVSYKVLSGAAANPEDFDIMLMKEYRNFGSLDNSEAQWDAIFKKVLGGEEAAKALNESRIAMREIYGDKFLRELKF